jgi:cell wall assembly regulator SMI1
MDTVEHNWNRIETWLASNLPEVIADLNPPASEAAIAQAETTLGLTLPGAFKTIYRIHDGQREAALGVFFGHQFMSLDQLLMRYADWKAIVVHDPVAALGADLPMTSTPDGAIQLRHADAAWIPFTEAGASENFGLDFHPAQTGTAGQVILFGRDVRDKVVIAKDLPSFLAWVGDELERSKGSVYESSGLKIFGHADLRGLTIEDGLRQLLYSR